MCGNYYHWQNILQSDKIAAFVLWKAKLPPKDRRNQPQLPKATLKRILMLPRTVERIPAQEPVTEPENFDESNAKESAAVY